MSAKAVLALAAFVICTLAGNLCFKLSAAQTGALSLSLGAVMQLATRWPVILGLLSYGIAMVAWLVSMSLVPLNLAASVSALTYVGIVLLAKFFFHETIALQAWFGIAMIAMGMVVVVRFSP